MWLKRTLAVVAVVCLTACGGSLTNDSPNALTADPALDAATPAGGGTPVAGGATPLAGGDKAAPDKAGKGAVLGAALPAGKASVGAGYKIGPQDVLEISVFKVPELTRTVQVAETGTVNLPLVGEIPVAGRSPKDVEKELTQKLGAKYLQSPQVSVSIREYNSQRVTIDGAVKKPGVIPYRSALSLLQVIAMADGLDPNSDSTVVVFRETKGDRQAARFDISEIRSGAAKDPAIEPGDTIIVGSSAVKEAFNNVLKALPLAGLFVGL